MEEKEAEGSKKKDLEGSKEKKMMKEQDDERPKG